MILRTLSCLLLLESLSACGGSADLTANDQAQATGNYIERMQSLNEKERNAVLFRAIRDADRACQGVVRSVGTDPVNGNPGWIATCDDGGQWVVALGANGMAAVASAQDVAGAAKR